MVSSNDLNILAKASWRLAFMLVRENGPGNILLETRTKFGGAFNCVSCMSIWTAAIMLILWKTEYSWIVNILAISGQALQDGSSTGAGVVYYDS